MSEERNEVPVLRALTDFRSFYQREYRSVLGMAYALTGDRSVAEDLCQDAFVAAFRRWTEVGVMEYPDAWVRRVVANRSASRFRRLASEGRALFRLGPPSQEVPPPSEDSMAVWSALRRLPPRQAEIVVLIYFADLSHVDASALMGCSVETARTHLKRAKARLARALGDDE